MRTRALGSIAVSEIGMGCMGLSHGYGPIPDEDYSIGAIRAAPARDSPSIHHSLRNNS